MGWRDPRFEEESLPGVAAAHYGGEIWSVLAVDSDQPGEFTGATYVAGIRGVPSSSDVNPEPNSPRDPAALLTSDLSSDCMLLSASVIADHVQSASIGRGFLNTIAIQSDPQPTKLTASGQLDIGLLDAMTRRPNASDGPDRSARDSSRTWGTLVPWPGDPWLQGVRGPVSRNLDGQRGDVQDTWHNGSELVVATTLSRVSTYRRPSVRGAW